MSETTQQPLQNNTDLYGLRSRILTNRTNIKQSTERFSDIQNTLANHQSIVDTVKSTTDDLLTRVQVLEQTKGITEECVVSKLSDYSVNNLEPVLNDMQDQLEALTIEVNSLKNTFPVRTAMDTDSARTSSSSGVPKVQIRSRSGSRF